MGRLTGRAGAPRLESLKDPSVQQAPSSRSRSRAVLRLLLLTLVPGLGGCGYTTGLNLAPEYQRIGLEIFGNQTPLPDLELTLHRHMTRAARNLVSATLVSPNSAHLVVRGNVVQFQRRAGLRNKDNVWLEGGITMIAEATLVDGRDNQVVVGPLRASVSVGFARVGRETEGQSRERAIQNLAERLVLDLFSAGPVRG